MNRDKLLVANGITDQISKLDKQKIKIQEILQKKKDLRFRGYVKKWGWGNWYWECDFEMTLSIKILQNALKEIEDELDLLNAQLDEL